MNKKVQKNRIDLKWKAFVTLITTVQKFGVSKNLFLGFIFGGKKLENTFIHQR